MDKIFYWQEKREVLLENVFFYAASIGDTLVMSGIDTEEAFWGIIVKFRDKNFPNHELVCSRDPNDSAFTQLFEYIYGQREKFDLKIQLIGSDFQNKVWQQLLRIPYGETKSYSQIAAEVGCPKAQRAVGMANNKNNLGIIVPCHRVIGKNGQLTGYASGILLKEKLLRIEKNIH